MASSSSNVGKIVQDIDPEALFKEMVLLQEGDIADLKQLYERAVKTAKDRRTPEFFSKISNVVEAVIKVFGERDACMAEYSSYSESPYLKENTVGAFELVANKLKDFVIKGREEKVEAVTGAKPELRNLYLATLSSLLDRQEGADWDAIILEIVLKRMERYYVSFVEHNSTACLLGNEQQRDLWTREAAAIETRFQNFIVSAEQHLAAESGNSGLHPAPTSTPPPDNSTLEQISITSSSRTAHTPQSKSRVGPVKVTSIPRLQLKGALLLTELMGKVTAALSAVCCDEFNWCDSKVALHWIPCKWQQFIHESTDKGHWFHLWSLFVISWPGGGPSPTCIGTTGQTTRGSE